MRDLSVKTGEIVERGQKIGAVGTTGFSTGPHLHFMISYYSMNLEPGYFLVGQPITYENYQEYFSKQP
jgi:murein DD-endopeptidase MepM/ murein hydrolase activator NlpD